MQKTSAYIPRNNIPFNIIEKKAYDPQSTCNLCGESLECDKCIEFNQYLQSSNISNAINNYKLQLYNKDKTIMNYSKQLAEQNKKFELMENALKIKDDQINKLEQALKDLSTQMENIKNENINNNELIEKYKYQIETQIQQSEHNQSIYDNNFSTMSNRLEENKNKINELEELNSRLNGDINLLQKELHSKNEIIENKNILNKKLSSENKTLALMNKKIKEQEKNIKALNEEKISTKKYNEELIKENKALNEKINQILQELNQKENNSSLELYNINSKLSEVEKELKNTLEELNKNKKDKEALIKAQEQYYNFINQKLNEIDEFIIKALNNCDINELTQDLKNINSLSNNNKYFASNSDIKYELVENAIFEIKKNIIKFILNTLEKNDRFINEYNLISRDKDILKSHNNEIINELNEYKQNQNEIENKNKEIAFNYEKLKDSYTKLYNDYNKFTNSNAKYVDDIHQFFFELIQQINRVLGIDTSNISNETNLDEVLKKKIYLLIKENEVMNLKIKENEKKDEITFNKIIEMEKLLEESHKVGKEFEEENRELKQEIEKLGYRYNLLKASIDTVENQIKLGDI